MKNNLKFIIITVTSAMLFSFENVFAAPPPAQQIISEESSSTIIQNQNNWVWLILIGLAIFILLCLISMLIVKCKYSKKQKDNFNKDLSLKTYLKQRKEENSSQKKNNS